MILELATVDIQQGTNADFEQALEKAQSVISTSKGYLGHQFQKCIEKDNRYVFLIRWETLEDHTVGFRESDLFKAWRALIGPFFETPPQVQHYELKFEMQT
ncbi:MAG: antibiotic biosynthesis monooxygenase [Ferruginibacter sp.]